MGVLGVLKDPDSDWSAWDYVRHICAVLTDIAQNVRQVDDDNEERRIRRGFVIALDGTGNGQAILNMNPGNSLDLLAWAFQTIGAPAGYLAFYRDVEEGTGLVLNTPVAAVASGVFNSEGHYLPPQTSFLVVVRGGPANGQVSGNVTGINNVRTAVIATRGGGEF